MKVTIGKRIRKIRDERELTQENVASELNITTGAFAKIERGETDAPISKILKIAGILGVHVSELFKDLPKLSTNEPLPKYGFATKSDILELVNMLESLKREIENLKVHPPATQIKTAPFKKRKK